MEGMGLKFAPVIVRHLLVPLSMFGPMAGTSWTHSQSGSEIRPGDRETSLSPSKHVWAHGWHFLDSYLI